MVISIITVLIALLLPALEQARSAARRTVCGTQLRQFGIALANYAQEHNGYFPGDKFFYWNSDPAGTLGGLPLYIDKTQRQWIMNTYQVAKPAWFCPLLPDGYMNNWNGDIWPGTSDPFRYNYGRIGYMMLSHLDPTGIKPPYTPRHRDSAQPEWELMADIVAWQTARPFLTGNVAHVSGNGQPAGGNILHVGGHVRWRPFEDYDMDTYTTVTTFPWRYYAW